jgi:hypothetical protein
MVFFVRRFGATALAALAALAVLGMFPALGHAQRMPVRPQPAYITPNAINPNWQVAPGLSLNQWAFNTTVMGRTYAQFPPYVLGYNPYPQYINSGINFPPPYYGGGGYGGGGLYGYNPYAYGSSMYTPYSTGGATLSTNPYYGPSGSPDAYGTGGAYTNPYVPYVDPYGGYMTGVANVINASGTYSINNQRALLLNEEVKRSRLDTRRKIMEEARYERMNTPTPEDYRQMDLESAYNRARRDPPVSEIWSGKSLNDLLRNLKNQQGKGLKGPNVPLDEDTLKHVNLTVTDVRGNVGLLKNDGKLQWPTPLQDAKYTEARQKLTDLIAAAVQQVKVDNKIEVGAIKDMQTNLQRMKDTLDKSVPDMSPSQYIESMRYLSQVTEAVTTLEKDPNVADLLSNTWIAKSKNVAELVQHMAKKGLSFAPATPGDEGAYRALHYALTSFDANLGMVAKSGEKEKDGKYDKDK